MDKTCRLKGIAKHPRPKQVMPTHSAGIPLIVPWGVIKFGDFINPLQKAKCISYQYVVEQTPVYSTANVRKIQYKISIFNSQHSTFNFFLLFLGG